MGQPHQLGTNPNWATTLIGAKIDLLIYRNFFQNKFQKTKYGKLISKYVSENGEASRTTARIGATTQIRATTPIGTTTPIGDHTKLGDDTNSGENRFTDLPIGVKKIFKTNSRKQNLEK